MYKQLITAMAGLKSSVAQVRLLGNSAPLETGMGN
jgi:hypothetical protein